MSDKIFIPRNENAQDCVKNVMKYLSDITYDKIITGHHTQTMVQEELHYIEQVTGKQPARSADRWYYDDFSRMLYVTATAADQNEIVVEYEENSLIIKPSHSENSVRL